MRIIAFVIAIAVATVMWTPAAGAEPASVRARENLTTFAMHFGGGNGSGAVTPEMFDGFYEEIVAPRFPEGTSIAYVDGRWHDPKTSTMVKEKSYVIEVEGNPGGETEAEAKVAEIAEEYVRLYGKVNASCFVKKYRNTATTLYYAPE